MEKNAHRRVQKETRYNPLIKIIKEILKSYNLIEKYGKQAQDNKIPLQKNYRIIFLGISLIEQKLVGQNMTNQNIFSEFLRRVHQQLGLTLKGKYLKKQSQNSDFLMKKSSQKNLQDLQIIQQIFYIQSRHDKLMKAILKGLYKTQQKNNIQEILDVIIKFRTKSFEKYNEMRIQKKQHTIQTQIVQMEKQDQMENKEQEIEIASVQGGYTRFRVS